MSTVEDVVPLEPAAPPQPAGSWLIGPLADSIALISATLTLFVLSGITPLTPVPALATALNVLHGLLHGGAVPAATSAMLLQAAIVVLLLIGNVALLHDDNGRSNSRVRIAGLPGREDPVADFDLGSLDRGGILERLSG